MHFRTFSSILTFSSWQSIPRNCGLIFFIWLLASGCSGKNDGIIGERLSDSTPLYNAYGIESNRIFLVDTPTNRILNVNIDSMTIENSFALSKPKNKHTLANSPSGSYVIEFSTKHLEVIRADGSREERPFAFQGTPVSAAYNPKKGILAMQDDLQSIGLLVLAENGKILQSFLGGPLINKSKSLLAGDIDSNGRLVLAASDKSITIVDVEASINASQWKSESFDTDIADIKWLAPDSYKENLSLVVATDSIAVVDLQTKSVTDKLPLSENSLQVIGKSKLVKPHVVVVNSKTGLANIYYIGTDGKFETHEVSAPAPAAGIGEYTTSYLDQTFTELSILYSRLDSHRIIKSRLSDNLVVLDKTVAAKGDARLGPKSLFVNKKSQFGYLQAFELKSEGVKELKGFNFDLLRAK